MAKAQMTLNESLAALVRGVLTRVRALEADPYGLQHDDEGMAETLEAMDSDLQAILSLLGKVKTIPAGTIGALGEDDPSEAPVVAVIELTLAELVKLTDVCGHDGFGMIPEAAEAALAEMGGAL
jgi:hypothetical protein